MCKILLVEDEEIEIFALKKILLDNLPNIEIVGAAKNGYEALHILERNQIDLAFVDINIPGINGLDVIKFIKSNYPKIVIIVMTANDTFQVEHASLKLKVNDYLIKPVKPSVIIDTFKQYFGSEEEDYNISLCRSYIKELRKELLNDQLYNNSINIIKKFIFEIYENTSFSNSISKLIIDFANGIIKICEEMNIKSIDNIKMNVDIIKSKGIHTYAKYEMYKNFVNIINLMFDEILKSSNVNNNELDIARVLNYIDRNIKDGISLDEVADYANMSIYYMSKVFKKEKNINFINYITDRKMDIAKEILINTNDPIINIAIELSYDEANYFSKVFKKNVGITPTEYREKFTDKLCATVNS